jgi:hypothetical protein
VYWKGLLPAWGAGGSAGAPGVVAVAGGFRLLVLGSFPGSGLRSSAGLSWEVHRPAVGVVALRGPRPLEGSYFEYRAQAQVRGVLDARTTSHSRMVTLLPAIGEFSSITDNREYVRTAVSMKHPQTEQY